MKNAFEIYQITYIGHKEYIITDVNTGGVCIQTWINNKTYTMCLMPEEADMYLRHFKYDVPENNSPILTLTEEEAKAYLRPRLMGGSK